MAAEAPPTAEHSRNRKALLTKSGLSDRFVSPSLEDAREDAARFEFDPAGGPLKRRKSEGNAEVAAPAAAGASGGAGAGAGAPHEELEYVAVSPRELDPGRAYSRSYFFSGRVGGRDRG